MTTFADRNNVIDCRGQRVRVVVAEVHGLAADTAHGLSLEDLLSGFLERSSVSWKAVGSFAYCHCFTY